VMQGFQKTLELTGGNFSLEIHDCIANDDHAVVIGTVRGERNGKEARRPLHPRRAHARREGLRVVDPAGGPVRRGRVLLVRRAAR
jgi:hypothetical protein